MRISDWSSDVCSSDLAWHFTTTLTQNLNRGAVSSGQVTLSVEGTSDGKLQTLDWDALRQQPDAPGIAYSFKYFQEVGGDLMLPPGYQPLRVIVRLAPKSGAAVEQSFHWTDASRRSAPGAYRPSPRAPSCAHGNQEGKSGR